MSLPVLQSEHSPTSNFTSRCLPTAASTQQAAILNHASSHKSPALYIKPQGWPQRRPGKPLFKAGSYRSPEARQASKANDVRKHTTDNYSMLVHTNPSITSSHTGGQQQQVHDTQLLYAGSHTGPALHRTTKCNQQLQAHSKHSLYAGSHKSPYITPPRQAAAERTQPTAIQSWLTYDPSLTSRRNSEHHLQTITSDCWKRDMMPTTFGGY